ncbi:MAG: YncE family protein [Peptostreptococcaceae bacterium]
MKVYISNYLSKSISVLNYPTFELEKEIELEEDIHPHHFCVDSEKNLMYIPGTTDGILYILDLTTNKIVDNISIGGNLSQVSLVNGELFISNEDSNSIYILDQETAYPIGIIGVDDMPHSFDVDETTNKLYVSCINSIVSIDMINKCMDDRIDTEFKAWHINVDKEKKEIYTATLDGKLVILSEENMKITNIVEDFLLPTQICFNYTYGKVFVADIGYKNIIILDYNTGKQVGCIEIDGVPQGVEISKDDKLLLISDTQKNSIKVYDILENKFIKEIKVGKEPTTILCV